MTVAPKPPVDLQLDGGYPLHDIPNNLPSYEMAILRDQIIRTPPQFFLQLLQELHPPSQAGTQSRPDLDINSPAPSVQPMDIEKQLNIMRDDKAFQTSQEGGFVGLHAIETVNIGIPQFGQGKQSEAIGLMTEPQHDEIRKLILGFQAVFAVVISPIMGNGMGGGENNGDGTLNKEVFFSVALLPLQIT